MQYLVLESVLVPILTIGGTVLMIVLAYIAQAMVKAGDMNIEVKRQAFLDPREVLLGIHFYSTKKHAHTFNNIVLAAEIEGELLTISEDVLAPVTFKQSKNLVTNEKGYSLTIKSGKAFDGVFRFTILKQIDPDKIKVAYLLATDKEGHKLKAPFYLSSTETQEISFSRIKEKK